MQELFNIGLSVVDIQEMVDCAPNIQELDGPDIKEAIEILRIINCTEKQIQNILLTNPFYLNKSPLDTLKLVKKMGNLGIKYINLLFDTNPCFLNYEEYEIENYVNQQMKLNLSLREIASQIEDNPFVLGDE